MPDSPDLAAAVAATLQSPRDGESLHRRPVGLSLEVIEGPDRGRSFKLTGQRMTGGRGASHEIVLTDDSVSTSHFEITLGHRGVFLRDLGSTNGTWTGRGAKLVDGTVALYDGAMFHAGDTQLRVMRIDVGEIARSGQRTLGSMVGDSPAIRELFALMTRVAPTPVKALITGETGTGKEEVARTLHALSGRKGPFVVLDCSTLPVGLADSAILGHDKGAFTGATEARPGAFEAADGGTVFIDEIGELPLEQQPKLLRVLDGRGIVRLGGTPCKPVDVRVLAATHRDLRQLVAAGTFRADLYERLGVVELEVPPLRERVEDVPLLVGHFLAAERARHGDHTVVDIDADALAALAARYWEGNVRELRHAVEALAHLSSGPTITLADVGRFLRRQRSKGGSQADALALLYAMPGKAALDEFQRGYVRAAEKQFAGDTHRMCQHMDYTPKGLRGLCDRLGIARPGQGRGDAEAD